MLLLIALLFQAKAVGKMLFEADRRPKYCCFRRKLLGTCCRSRIWALMLLFRITLLFQAKAVGKMLFEQVCKQLNLLETDYFGLEYMDTQGVVVSLFFLFSFLIKCPMKEMFVLYFRLFISQLVYNNIYKNNNKYFPIVNKSLFLQYYYVCFLL